MPQQQHFQQEYGDEYDDESGGEIDPNMDQFQDPYQQYADEEDEEEQLSPDEIKDIINSYTAFRYEEPQPDPQSKNEKEPINCAICQDVLKTGQMVKALPCTHKYHSKCINEWLKVKLKCPLCKQALR